MESKYCFQHYITHKQKEGYSSVTEVHQHFQNNLLFYCFYPLASPNASSSVSNTFSNIPYSPSVSLLCNFVKHESAFILFFVTFAQNQREILCDMTKVNAMLFLFFTEKSPSFFVFSVKDRKKTSSLNEVLSSLVRLRFRPSESVFSLYKFGRWGLL